MPLSPTICLVGSAAAVMRKMDVLELCSFQLLPFVKSQYVESERLSTEYYLFWSSFKFLEIHSLYGLFLAQKLQIIFTLFFCHFPTEQMCWFFTDWHMPLNCNSIYLDSENCEDLQLLWLTSYSRVTNQHLNMSHECVRFTQDTSQV